MGDILKRTIRREDGLLLWECMYNRHCGLDTTRMSFDCPTIEETIDLETGDLISRYEFGISGRITAMFSRDGYFEVVALDCSGKCLVSNPIDSGVLIQIISPEVKDIQPGEEFRAIGSIKWREVPLESKVLQEA